MANPVQDFLNAFSQVRQLDEQNQMNAERKKMMALEQQLLQKKVTSPLGATVFPGVAGEVQGLNYLAQHYGQNSPQYQEAQQAFKAKQKYMQQRGDYMVRS